MIDLHCHMLPAVDDGAKTISTAISMAQEAENEGITKILLTPHHMDGEYVNHKKDIVLLVDNLQKILRDNGLNVQLRAGQEVHITGDLINAIDSDDILYADGSNKKYMMLEFPHSDVPKYAKNIIFDLIVRGIRPVVVHPERNHGIQKNPEILYDLVEMGCLTQLTATSYVGGFGKTIQKFTDDIVKSGLGFVIASDAHNLEGRRFEMESAFDRLERKMGKDKVYEYKRNAELIWDGKDVHMEKFKKISENKGTFKKLKSLFRKKRR